MQNNEYWCAHVAIPQRSKIAMANFVQRDSCDANALGVTGIDCLEALDDPISAELWEIAEDLHRLDLTKDQRDQHIGATPNCWMSARI